MRIWEHGRPPAPLDAVGVLPWLDLREPIVIGDVFVYPTTEGLLHLGDQAQLLRERLTMYRPAWEHGRAVNPGIVLHRRQISEAIALPADEVRRAIDILIAAASYRDNSVFTTNSTTFQLYFHRLGGGEGHAFAVRRRNGYMLSGGMNANIPQPLHAGTYLWHDSALLDALLRCIECPQRYRLFDALGWYRRASADSEYTDRDIDRVLLRTAIDFLVANDNTPANGTTDLDRVDELLAPFTLRVCERIKGREFSHIRCALYALNHDRNGTLHPRMQSRDTIYSFERRPNLLLDWIADRCFFALLTARLIELGELPLSEETRAYVEGVEAWLADPAEDDLSKVQLARRGRLLLERGANEIITSLMNQVDPDLDNPEWRTAFYAALGNEVVDEQWIVNLFWRRNDGGPLAQILESLPRAQSFRDVIDFDPNESPQDAAAAVRYWCDHAGRTPAK